MTAICPSSMKCAYDGSASSRGSRSSSRSTSRNRNVWNAEYHSRSQCVCGTMWTVLRVPSMFSPSVMGPVSHPCACSASDRGPQVAERAARAADADGLAVLLVRLTGGVVDPADFHERRAAGRELLCGEANRDHHGGVRAHGRPEAMEAVHARGLGQV